MNPHDRLLQTKQDYVDLCIREPILDWWRRQPGNSISRRFGAGPSYSSTREYRVEPGHLLCAGAAAVLSKGGIVRHARPWDDGPFCGFIEAMVEGDKVVVRVRGVVWLRVSDVQERHVGSVVLCKDVNEFTLAGTGRKLARLIAGQPADRSMGQIVALEPGKPGVAQVKFAGCDAEPAKKNFGGEEEFYNSGRQTQSHWRR